MNGGGRKKVGNLLSVTTSLVRKARQMTIKRNAYRPEQVMNRLCLKEEEVSFDGERCY